MLPFVSCFSKKMNDLQPIAKSKALTAENRKANQKHEQQQFSVSYWGQPRQNITSGPLHKASNPQQARQHSRTDPPANGQQANHNTSPDVPGPLFPGVRANANIVRGKFRMMPLGNEVGSSFSV